MRTSSTVIAPVGHRSTRRSARFGVTAAALLVVIAALVAPNRVFADHHDSDGADSDGAWLMSGTWTAGRDDHQDRLWLSLRCDNGAGSRHEHWSPVEAGELHGLDLRTLGASRTPVEFTVTRDAGTVRAHGEFSGDRGAGTFELELDPKYADTLEKRGVGRPTQGQQARLLLGDADLGLLDALQRERYAVPRVTTLIRLTDHGVREETVAGLAKAGYRLGTLDELVTAIDHGVNPEFVRSMADAGYHNLEFETLVKARDHGADAGFVEDLSEAGYKHLPLEQLIQARDHGVDAGYIESLRRAGFERLALDDAIRARDHGVTSGYARRMREKRPEATLDEVISWRDRGVKP